MLNRTVRSVLLNETLKDADPQEDKHLAVQFLDSGELFLRPHSAGWAQSDGRFYPLHRGYQHNQDVDWSALSEDLYSAWT